ncbi:hypothetical protein ACQ859_05745 [Roseateles chitinivorans]
MNCFVIENPALDIDVRDIIWGLPFGVVLLICIFPTSRRGCRIW